MDWIPLDRPRPEDGKRYDIRLTDGRVVTAVTYWDYGCGFDPLELEEKRSGDARVVRYPISQVAAYRPSAER
ncbi:MAG: hypothetical protein QNJ22_02680 [Desulfosarcinaceae bacterium]|nr:hypothetical protein [Desulfosarcinaceae bacterium]